MFDSVLGYSTLGAGRALCGGDICPDAISPEISNACHQSYTLARRGAVDFTFSLLATETKNEKQLVM